MSKYRFVVLRVVPALVVLAAFSAPVVGIVTSDGFGTHVIEDGTPLEPVKDVPPINHDSVSQLHFFRPDFNPPQTFCSSALIATPQGAATLTAAHCLTNNSGQLVATSFSATYYELGVPVVFTTSDPENVFIHPNYDGTGWHGFDLAVVFWDQPVSHFVHPVYSVTTNQDPALFAPIVKFGFGRTGFGGGGGTILDQEKRWGLNKYEYFALGDFGVPAPGGWDNSITQYSMDFDSGNVANDIFSFYDLSHQAILLGYGGDEVMGSRGDSGGPNFIYDPAQGGWVIVAVNSYVFRIPNSFGPPGNTDVDGMFNFSWGEYEGDARIDAELLDQVLGLAQPPPKSTEKPYSAGPAGGGHLKSFAR
jgi:hypothetical protein